MPQGLAPTLLVGLGTSGLRILSELEKLIYATFGKNRLPFFRCLYVETNVSENPEKTPADSEITPVKLRSPHGLRETYENLLTRDDLDLDWLAQGIPDQVPSTEQGAGGVRPAGRMLLWGETNFGDFYQAIQNAKQEIDQAVRQPDADLQEVNRRSGAELDQQARAFVVGSLVGGTGSGIFIDVGYVIQKITSNRHNLYGIFLLPKEDDNLTFGFGNCYGALKEFDYYCGPTKKYAMKCPNQVTLHPGVGPYTICYLASTAYGQAQLGDMRLASLYKVVALRLFCELLGLSQLRGSELTDQASAAYTFFGGFGISAVMHPKSSVTEAAACRLGQALCDRWLDRNTLRDPVGAKKQIVHGELLNKARALLDKCLEDVFHALGARGGEAASLDGDIGRDADHILRKIKPAADLLRDQFSRPSAGNYYLTVHENLPMARQLLAKQIAERVSSLMDETQNLTCAELLLESLQQRIEETLRYWGGALEIPSSASEWPDWVSHQIDLLLKQRNRLFLLHRDTLIDRMRELLKILKMFALRATLEDLKTALQTGVFTHAGHGPSVPSSGVLQSFRQCLEETRNRLVNRDTDIQSEVADKSVPVMRVWQTGGFDTDVQALRQAFGAQVPHLKDVSDKSSWELFAAHIREPGRIDAMALFEVIKANYQKRLYPVISRQEFKPVSAAMQQIGTTAKYARMATAGLLRLSGYTRQQLQGIPRFVLGPNDGQLRDLVQALRKSGCEEFSPDQVRALPLLDHGVIFYDEQPNVRPLDLLVIRDRLKEHYENKDQSFPFSREVWKAHRLAYATEPDKQVRRRRREEVRELIRFLLDFGIRWEHDFQQGRKAGGPQWNWLRLWLGAPPVPPKFQFQDRQGLERGVDLEPEDNRGLRSVAADEDAFTALNGAVRRAVVETGKPGLTKIFNEQVNEQLLRERRQQSEIDNIRDFYFYEPSGGQQGELKEKGFILRILEQEQQRQPRTEGA